MGTLCARAKPNKTAYLGFRLPEEEVKAIEAAAAADESVSEYVRKAIALRMKERKPLLPPASLTYQISPVKIDDNKLASFEGTSNRVLPTEVKSVVTQIHVAEDDSSHKEA